MITLKQSDIGVKDIYPQPIYLMNKKKVTVGVWDQVSINIHSKIWNSTRGQLYESIKEIIWSH
jgi:hypothetical protein